MISASVEQTNTLAKRIAAKLAGGDVLCLHGELGSGKTTFVKALALALGVTETITSPTFALMNLYEILENKKIKKLVHIDTFRLKDAAELTAIGVQDYLGKENMLCVVEWPEKIIPLLAGIPIKNIYFEHMSPTQRRINVED